jgi:nucleoside 2-deoxyribosyltransferase/Zn ribbon nucleic-acid-binding protein
MINAIKEDKVIEESRCLFCGCITNWEYNRELNIEICDCVECGKYAVSKNAFKYLDEDWISNIDAFKANASVFYYYKHKSFDNRIPCFVFDDYQRNDGNYKYINYDDLIALYPKTFSDRADKIVVNLPYIFQYAHTLDLKHPWMKMRLWLFIDEYKVESDLNGEIRFIFNLLEELGYVTRVENDIYRISAKGWQRIDELERSNTTVPQGFIAMWFDESMITAQESIREAIRQCGYTPMIIDKKEHNNQIVPEILYEIRNSIFVVAELTGNRTGVYYEAGYAEALGKEVILLCREDYFNDRHFDVAQKNTIKWYNESDLYEKLVKRIIATVGTNYQVR